MSRRDGPRIAAGLPSDVPPEAVHRRAFEATLMALAERGAEVECFAEHDRLREPVGELTLLHYLRLPERHRVDAFDAAIYPLERDAGPYEPIYWMMHRFPGLVWLHDPALHHLAVAGMALIDRVPGYLELLERQHGGGVGAPAETVVSGWGSAAFYRSFELTRAILAEQIAVVTPWEALARRIGGELTDVEVSTIPLPRVEGGGPSGRREESADEGGSRSPREGRRDGPGAGTDRPAGGALLRFVSTNPSFLLAEMAALEEIVAALPEVRVEVCLPPVIRDVVYGPAAARRGLAERIDWLAIDEWDELADAVLDDEADLLVFLREDLRGGELALLQKALAAGSLVAVPALPLYDDLPEGAVAKVPFGAALGPGLVAVVREFLEDDELRRGVRSAARVYGGRRPGVAEVAAAWIDRVSRGIEEGAAPRLRPVSSPTWERVRADLEVACVPDGLATGASDEIRAVLDEQMELVRGDRG